MDTSGLISPLFDKLVLLNFSLQIPRMAYLLASIGLDKYFFLCYTCIFCRLIRLYFYNLSTTHVHDRFRRRSTVNFDKLFSTAESYSKFRHNSTNFAIRQHFSTFFDKFRQFSSRFDIIFRHFSTFYTIFFRQHFSTFFDSFFRQISTNFADSEV